MERRRIDFAADEDNNGTIRITAATCHDLDGTEKYRFGPNEGIEMRFRFESDREIERPHVSVRMTDGRPGAIIECSMLEDGEAPAKVGREWECALRIESLPLRPRLYQVWVEVEDESAHGQLMDWIEAAAFRVEAPAGSGPQAVVAAALGGPVAVPYRWEVNT